MQVTQWDFQNKGTHTSPDQLSFVLKVPLCNLCPSIIKWPDRAKGLLFLDTCKMAVTHSGSPPHYKDGCSFPQCGPFGIFFSIKTVPLTDLRIFSENSLFKTYLFDNRDSSRDDVCTLCGDGHSSVNKHTILNVNYLNTIHKPHLWSHFTILECIIVPKNSYDLLWLPIVPECYKLYKSLTLSSSTAVCTGCRSQDGELAAAMSRKYVRFTSPVTLFK